MNTLALFADQASTIRSPETMADTARDAVDAVKTKVGDALDRGQAAISHASDTASEMAEMATQQVKGVRVGNWRPWKNATLSAR